MAEHHACVVTIVSLLGQDGEDCSNLNYTNMQKGYFHVSSHGLERNDIFRSKADFIQGMNDVALCILGYDVFILAFCLMSNHFHFVLYGTLDECRRFAHEYKRRCAIRMRQLSGEVKGMKEIEIRIDEITTQEYLESAIAYVLRNCLAAGIRVMPYNYMWSSACLYFAAERSFLGEKLNDMSERKRYRILRSRHSVPDSYMVDENGMIHPSCYVKVDMVENIFRHPARLLALMGRKVENEVELSFGITQHVTMTDQELLTQVRELVKVEFGKSSICQIAMEDRIKLCLVLKRNFGAGVKQIARVLRLGLEIVEKVV